MKILYAIQGTGNGHITVAREVLPILNTLAVVDVLVSGTQVDVNLDTEVKYRLHGMSFIFGKKGGIDYLETYKKSNIKQLFREIESLPINDYDLVISDFEPVSAWACYLNNKPCIGFSHQAAVINKNSPKPDKKDRIGRAVLKYYAPASFKYGFHYLPYAENIFTPVIRKEIRELQISDNGHYVVYLPSYSDKKIIKLLSLFPKIQWEVFSKHSSEAYSSENINIRPINNDEFLKTMASSSGTLCNAGFQTPAETLFLKKKLMIIPMKGQYEQHCNAAALKMLGVQVLKNFKPKEYLAIKNWLDNDKRIILEFPDETRSILEYIIENHSMRKHDQVFKARRLDTPSKFRELIINKMFY